MQNTDNFRSNAGKFNNSSAYITTFKIFIMEEATSISIELANKACIYLFTALKLTMESTTEFYIETDLFTYNIATTIAL